MLISSAEIGAYSFYKVCERLRSLFVLCWHVIFKYLTVNGFGCIRVTKRQANCNHRPVYVTTALSRT